jgi:hypothetical protein
MIPAWCRCCDRSDTAADVSISTSALGIGCTAGTGCLVADVWNRALLGRVTVEVTGKAIPSRDSVFVVITE